MVFVAAHRYIFSSFWSTKCCARYVSNAWLYAVRYFRARQTASVKSWKAKWNIGWVSLSCICTAHCILFWWVMIYLYATRVLFIIAFQRCKTECNFPLCIWVFLNWTKCWCKISYTIIAMSSLHKMEIQRGIYVESAHPIINIKLPTTHFA